MSGVPGQIASNNFGQPIQEVPNGATKGPGQAIQFNPVGTPVVQGNVYAGPSSQVINDLAAQQMIGTAPNNNSFYGGPSNTDGGPGVSSGVSSGVGIGAGGEATGDSGDGGTGAASSATGGGGGGGGK
jgi:hypothetical protein